MAYNGNNYQNNNGNIQYGNKFNSGPIPNGMPPHFGGGHFSPGSNFGGSWSNPPMSMHNGYTRDINPQQYNPYSQINPNIGVRPVGNRTGSMGNQSNPGRSGINQMHRWNNSIGVNLQNNPAGYPGQNYQIPGSRNSPFGGQVAPPQENPVWLVNDFERAQRARKSQASSEGVKRIMKKVPTSPKQQLVTGAVKINGCGDVISAGDDDNKIESDNIQKPPTEGVNSPVPQGSSPDKTAWRLQAPGMPLFPKNGAKNMVQNQPVGSASRQGKAERKNTNLEPKAWLYAWLGFRHIRPTYTQEAIGQRPDQHFKCTLNADGFDKVAQGVAQSKKEAQTEAAWEFIDWLESNNKLMTQELEHIATMRKKAKGIMNSIRDVKPAGSDQSKERVNEGINEEVIISQMEQLYNNKTKVVTLEPPWVRGEQQVNTMDEFWRRKEMSENCPGGPAVKTVKPPGGATAPIGTEMDTKSVPTDKTISANHIESMREETLQNTSILPPPVIISGKTQEVAMGVPIIRIPPFTGAQPGSPFPPQSVMPPLNYMYPPPPLYPDMYGVPPPPPTQQVGAPYLGAAAPAGPHGKQFYDANGYEDNQIPQTKTADNIRDMLDDITLELTVEGLIGANTPCRNEGLEFQDILLLEHCAEISIKSESLKVLQNLTQIVESSLRSLSDALVREETIKLNRKDLTDIIDDAKNNNKVRILKRNDKKEEITEEQKKLKDELNQLRIIRTLYRIGNLPMGNLLIGQMESDLVLCVTEVPTKALLDNIVKLLPSCFDKNLNVGVYSENEVILINGEILNEKVCCRIHLSSLALSTKETVIPENVLGVEKMKLSLLNVRRVNFWKDIGLNISPIMDNISRLFLSLQNDESHVLNGLSEWQLLLVLYFSIGCSDTSMLGPVDAVRRICEVLLSGEFFFNGGLRDPVESEPKDFFESFDPQVAENISSWAGKALRLAAFDRIEEVFNIPEESESKEPDEENTSGTEIDPDTVQGVKL